MLVCIMNAYYERRLADTAEQQAFMVLMMMFDQLINMTACYIDFHAEMK